MKTLYSMIFTVAGGTVYAMLHDSVDPEYYYLTGFIVGFIAGKIQGV